MTNSIRLTLALAASVIVLPALAAERTPLSSAADASRAAAVANRPQLSHVRMSQPASTDSAATPKAMGTQIYPGTPGANAFRAYPPSCAADPLPDKSSGPTSSKRVPLYTTDGDQNNEYAPEMVTVTVWRIACSSSGNTPPYNPTGAYNAMTLMRIDRDAQYEGDTSVWPTFPVVQVAQGNIGFDNESASLIRVPTEPNTVIADTPFDSPIYYSTTYVLENYPYQGAGYFTFSDAFTLRLNPVTTSSAVTDFSMAAYSPTPASYPDAFAPLPLDGYAAAQWINGDEGLLVQISEQYDSSGKMTRQLVFDLLTADLDGNPIWLVGNAGFPVGATSLNVDTIYLGAGLSHQPWGKVNIQMPSCGALDVTFTPNSGLPAPIPSFSGLTTYGRLFDANGMVCE